MHKTFSSKYSNRPVNHSNKAVTVFIQRSNVASYVAINKDFMYFISDTKMIHHEFDSIFVY